MTEAGLRQNFERREKTRISASSHIGPCPFLHVVMYTWANHAPSRTQSSCFCPSSPARPVLPGHSPGCADLPTATRCQMQVPSPRPHKPPAWPQANNIIRGAAAKCGVEERSDDRGPTFCLRRSPPQEPPEENASPAQRGPRREKTATALIWSAATSSYRLPDARYWLHMAIE